MPWHGIAVYAVGQVKAVERRKFLGIGGFIAFVINRKDGRRIIGTFPGPVIGRIAHGVAHDDVGAQLEPSPRLIVGLGSYVDTLVIALGLHDALLVEVVDSDHIGRLLGPSRDVEAVTVDDGIARDFVVPVGVGRRDEVLAAPQIDGLLEDFRVAALNHHGGILGRRGHLQFIGHGLHADIAIIGDFGLLVEGALLGRNDDYTIGGPYAVDGCSRGVFQNGNVLHVRVAQKVDVVIEHSVNHIERSFAGERPDAADADIRTRAGLSEIGNLNTGHLSLQGLQRIRSGVLDDFRALDRSNRSCQVLVFMLP